MCNSGWPTVLPFFEPLAGFFSFRILQLKRFVVLGNDFISLGTRIQRQFFKR